MISLAPPIDRTIRLQLLPAAGGTPPTFAQQAAAYTQSYLPQFILNPVKALTPVNPELVLVGPTAIGGKLDMGLGSTSGLAAAQLQPWYIGNIPITVKGLSYLGLYPTLSNPDTDMLSLLQFFRISANEFSPQAGTPGTSQQFMLSFSGYPTGIRRFIGSIKSLSWNEEVTKANLLDYTLEFVGKNSDQAALITGSTGGAQDMAVGTGTR